MTSHKLADFVTASEIARRLGVSRQRVSQLQTADPAFPAPLGRIGRSLVFDAKDVAAYVGARCHKLGRQYIGAIANRGNGGGGEARRENATPGVMSSSEKPG